MIRGKNIYKYRIQTTTYKYVYISKASVQLKIHLYFIINVHSINSL